MGWETFLTKDSAFSPRTCDWYTVSPLVYATFRLETCDDLCYATIQDTALNELVRLSKGNETFTIKAPGRYKICVKGVNTRGRIMVSVNAASAAGPDCCNDLQMKIEELEQKIDALPGIDTKTVVKAGINVTVSEDVVDDTHTYTVSSTAASLPGTDTKTVVKAGENINVTEEVEGDVHTYTVSSTAVSTDVEVKAGRNIDVSKGEEGGKTTFTVASTDPDIDIVGTSNIQVDKENGPDNVKYTLSIPDGTFVDTDTKTVVKAGTNVKVTEDVVGDTHTYNVSADTVEVVSGRNIDVSKNEMAGKTTFTVASTEPTVEVTAGKDIQVDKETLADTVNYKVSIPDGTFVDTDTKTVVKAGTNVTVSEEVLGDTHTFTVSSTAAGAGVNVQVSQGDNITVEQATLPGGTIDYKVSATVPDVSEFTTKTYVDDQNDATLQSAQTFATDAAETALNNAKAYTDTKAAETLTAANNHSDAHDASTLAAANAHANTKADAAETTLALAGKADLATTLSEIARIDAAINALQNKSGPCVRGPLPHEFNGDFLVAQGAEEYTAQGGTGFVGDYTGIDGVWAEKNGTASIQVRRNFKPQNYIPSGDENLPNYFAYISANVTNLNDGNVNNSAALKFFVPDAFAYCTPVDLSSSPEKFQKIKVALCVHPTSGPMGCKKVKVGLSVHAGDTPIADANQPEPVILTLNTSQADYPEGGWFIAEFDPSKAFANLPLPSVSDDMLKSFGYLKVTLTLSEAAGELAWQNGDFTLLRYRVLREGEEPCFERQAYQDALYDCQRYFQIVNVASSGVMLIFNGNDYAIKKGSFVRQMAKVPIVTADTSQTAFFSCVFNCVKVTNTEYQVLVNAWPDNAIIKRAGINNLKLTFDARPNLK